MEAKVRHIKVLGVLVFLVLLSQMLTNIVVGFLTHSSPTYC